MAGRFSSVLDVRTREQYRAAVQTVVGSAQWVPGADGQPCPLAVLVQCEARARLGGVMFGVDPLTGERHHIVIDVVDGSPEALVSGRALADHYVVTRRGRVVRATRTGAVDELDARLRRQLARMSRRAERTFGCPQDIEWLVDHSGRLVLLQSRPITAVPPARRRGERSVLLGPGPVAETFPDALAPLEDDLWVTPLREGIVGALRACGAVSARRLRRSPVVVTIGGRVAVDLDLIGVVGGRRGHWYSPAAVVRRLGAAWRVGRLRAVLPELVAVSVDSVDRRLEGVGRLDTLTPVELAQVVDGARHELAAVHLHEVLAGILLAAEPDQQTSAPTAAGSALAALAAGRAEGLGDGALIASAPEVVMLGPPQLGGLRSLPATTTRPGAWSSAPTGALSELGPREALRLRARWLQELLGRAAGELGERMVASGGLHDRSELERLRVDELCAMARGSRPPERLEHEPVPVPGPPLPSSFRWAGGAVLPVEERPRRAEERAGKPDGHGLAASGGRALGRVVHDPARISGDEPVVLVADHLAPALAGVLGRLAGLVSETGSPLSHLAILAREARVPAVVAVDGARRRFPVGCLVELDGATGEVRVVDPLEASP